MNEIRALLGEELMDAIDLASDQDQMTWLTDDTGRRIAAIVPVDGGEEYERMTAPEPPFDDNHHRYHSPANPLEDCASCRYQGWVA